MNSILSLRAFRRAQLSSVSFFTLLCAGLSAPGTSVRSATPAADRVTFTDSIKAIAPDGLARLIPSELAERMDFMVALKMRNFEELQARIDRGELIAPAEMAAKYYPLASDHARVAAWLKAQGFTLIETNGPPLGVFASGTVNQVASAFRVSFARVASDGRNFRSAVDAPSLPAALAPAVLGINGLQPHIMPRRHSIRKEVQPGPQFGNQPPYLTNEILKAYGATGVAATGANQKIAIIIDTFALDNDMTSFWNQSSVSQSLNNIEKIQVVAGSLPPPSGEESLDEQWTTGIAPDAKIRVYASTDLSFVHIDQCFQRLVADIASQPQMKQVSISLGLGENFVNGSQLQTDRQFFASMVAGGLTVFVSSGDSGSNEGGQLQVSYFASDVNVTAVGGTSLFLNLGSGSISNETVWNGSGGGVSNAFNRPSWQVGAGVPAGTKRLVPDLAAAADPNTGALVVLNGQGLQFGGTSWSAPMWAGLCARINQARAALNQQSLGLFGPKLYPLLGSASFRDTVTGGNGAYTANPGYDRCTGLGSPNLAELINVLTSTAPVLTTSAGSLAYIENQAPTVVDPGITVTDPDNTDAVSGSVSISNNFAAGQDILDFTPQGGVTGSYDPATGVLTLNGTAPLATYESVLRSVTYFNSSESPSSAARVVTFSANDGTFPGFGARGIVVTSVNDAPVANSANVLVDESTPEPIVLPGTDVDNAVLSYSIIVTPQHGKLSGVSPNLTYTPTTDYNGPDSFTYRVADGKATSATDGTISINVVPINDPPSFTVGPDQVIILDNTFRTVPGWATNINPGPSEGGQIVTFNVIADIPALFTTQPTVSSNGTLTFQGAPGAVGTTTVTITAQDDGGTAFGGNDTSVPKTFKILVNPANFVPIFGKGPDVIVPVDSGAYSAPWALNVSPGAAHESGQALDFILELDNPAIFAVAPTISAAGVLSFTPSPSTGGFAHVTVKLHDNGGTANGGVDTSATQSFIIAIASFSEEVGIYNGLLEPPVGVQRDVRHFGVAHVVISRKGAATVKLTLGGKNFSIKGSVDFAGGAKFGKSKAPTVLIKPPGLTLNFAMALDTFQGTDQIVGALTQNGTPFANLVADRTFYTKKKNPTPPLMNPPSGLLGKYTTRFAPRAAIIQGLPAVQFPQGDGMALVTVSSAGTARVTGTLADGTKFSASNALSKDNLLPFYALTDKKKGSISGRIAFRDTPGVSDVDGAGLDWFKPANPRSHTYPGGWAFGGIKVDFSGALFTVQQGSAVLPGLAAPNVNGNASVVLTAAALELSSIVKAVNIDSNNVVTAITPGADQLAVKLNAKTGGITGSFRFPLTGKTVKLNGLIVQKSKLGAGLFITGIQGGGISVTPNP